MGIRTVWACLTLGLACAPNTSIEVTRAINHEGSSESADAGQTVSGVKHYDSPSTLETSDADRTLGEGTDGGVSLDTTNEEVVNIPTKTLDAGPAPRLDGGHGNYGTPTSDAGVVASGVAPEGGASSDSVAASCDIPDVRGSECNVTSSCGCDDGMVCRVADRHTGQTLCFPPGETPLYWRCSLDQDCGAGAVCEEGLCREPCDTPGKYCVDGSSCTTLSAGGRDVCVGHCNVLERSPDVWSRESAWIKQMALQVELGKRTETWDADYVPCGGDAYCHPGLGPDEASNPRPLHPFCMPSTGQAVDNSYCTTHSDCVSGLACGIYPNESRGRCIRLGYVEGDCRNTGHGLQYGTGVGGDAFVGPDGLNRLGLCTKPSR